MGNRQKTMTKPIDVLKKGLKALRKQNEAWKSKIQADLDAQKSITESDEEWLDGEGNLVDEELVIDLLENASDYDEGFAGLCETDKNVVQRLKILAGAIQVAAPLGKQKMEVYVIINISSACWSNFYPSTDPEVKESTNHPEKCSQSQAVFTKKENATPAQHIELWTKPHLTRSTTRSRHY